MTKKKIHKLRTAFPVVESNIITYLNNKRRISTKVSQHIDFQPTSDAPALVHSSENEQKSSWLKEWLANFRVLLINNFP